MIRVDDGSSGRKESVNPPKIVQVIHKKISPPPLSPIPFFPKKPVVVIERKEKFVKEHTFGGRKSIFEITKRGGGDYPGYTVKEKVDGDDAKKLARIAAIKKAALSNKKYNVGTSTTADPEAGSVASILSGGGGGGYYGASGSGEGGSSGFSLSDIPSIVWIILAVGAGWFLIKSSGGKGKIF